LSILILKAIAGISLAVFFIALIAKAVKYARLPLHVRWELYPVGYGMDLEGSYLEKLEWWKTARHVDHLKQAEYILAELLLFKAYFHQERKYWFALLPFHLGLFLLMIWFVLLLLASFTPAQSTFNDVLKTAMLVAGGIGYIAAAAGCAGLLVQKITDSSRNLYASRLDYFSLAFILVTLLSGVYVWVFNFQSAGQYASFAGSGFGAAASMDAAVYINILLVSLLLIYMPFTRTLHYIAKYFTYHNLRWDDEPSERGSKLEKRAVILLGKPLSWSSPHIKSGLPWKDNAAITGNVKDEPK
jgi:nitrate reductase gamma subunit